MVYMTSSTSQSPVKNLKIWQQNINKSLIAQEDLLVSLKTRAFEICAIQEPYIDSFHNTRANSQWRVVYPKTHYLNPTKTRSVLLINTSLVTSDWHALDTKSGDVTAIRLKTNAGTIDIYNVYNDIKNNDSLQAMAQAAEKHEPPNDGKECHMIWLGDFNRHHPYWDEDRNAHLFTKSNLERAQTILDMVAMHNMEMALPKGIPTLRANKSRNLTRPDNVFISCALLESLTYCNAEPERQPVKTDHFPVITKIDVSIMPHEEPQRFNYKETDWEEFRNALKPHLQCISMPKTITSTQRFDNLLTDLNKAVTEVIEAVVPRLKLSPHTKRWWSNELRKMKKAVIKKGRKAHRQRFNLQHPIHDEYRVFRRQYAKAIRTAKQQHWEEWLESLNETTVWTASRYANSPPTDASCTKVPNLKAKPRGGERVIEATTNAKKSQLFYEAFYPEKPAQQPQESQSFVYPPNRWRFTPITDDQISRAIDNMLPYKATAPGTAPNCVLKETKDMILPYLGPLFRATFDLKYYPEEWARTRTVILKKPERPNYEVPGAWRPISLSNGFARLLNACIANEISNRCEVLNILPKNHFGARPGHSTTQAVHYLVTKVKDAWRKKKVVSALFLDVKGAFPSVNINQLIHDMHLRGIPVELTDWINRRMEKRKTQLSFDDYTSETFIVDNGLDQGDSFSPGGYMIYDSDILYIPNPENGEDAIIFIDDTVLVVIGDSYQETHRMLEDMMHRPGGVLQWADSHNCTFGVEKFQLIDFLRSKLVTKGRKGEGEAIHIRGHEVRPQNSAKYLGVTVDRWLNWKEHMAAAMYSQRGEMAQPVRPASKNEQRSQCHIHKDAIPVNCHS